MYNISVIHKFEIILMIHKLIILNFELFKMCSFH